MNTRSIKIPSKGASTRTTRIRASHTGVVLWLSLYASSQNVKQHTIPTAPWAKLNTPVVA